MLFIGSIKKNPKSSLQVPLRVKRNERELGVRRWRSMNGKNQVIRNARPTQKEQLQAQSETYNEF